MNSIEEYEEEVHTFLVHRLSEHVRQIKVAGKKTEHEVHILIYGMDQSWHNLAAQELKESLLTAGDILVQVQEAYLHYEGTELIVRASPLESEPPRGMVVSMAQGELPCKKN